MDYEELNILEVDASKLTIPKLKSILSAKGKTLPVTKEKKEAYVQLFEELQKEERQRLEDEEKKEK